MNSYNLPHPGLFIYATYIEPYAALSEREIVKNLDVAPSTFNRLIKGNSAASPEMAYCLSKVLG